MANGVALDATSYPADHCLPPFSCGTNCLYACLYKGVKAATKHVLVAGRPQKIAVLLRTVMYNFI